MLSEWLAPIDTFQTPKLPHILPTVHCCVLRGEGVTIWIFTQHIPKKLPRGEHHSGDRDTVTIALEGEATNQQKLLEAPKIENCFCALLMSAIKFLVMIRVRVVRVWVIKVMVRVQMLKFKRDIQ